MIWVIGLIAFIILAWLVLLRPGKREFEGLSETQLQRYVAYSAAALANGGWISIRCSGHSGSVTLRKRELKKSPFRLFVRFSVDDGKRESVTRVAEALERSGIEHRRIYTRRLGSPRAVEVTLDSTDPVMPAACTHIVRKMLESLGAVTSAYTVFLAGPFKSGFSPEDGEVIPRNASWRYGHTLGYLLGSLARSFRDRD
jgi:hypothetical protein